METETVTERFKNRYILGILNGTNPMTDELLLHRVKGFEVQVEEYLIDILSKLDIKATVKTDRYSLPHTDEIIATLNGESYLNGPFERRRIVKSMVKEMLNRNLYKVRFYIYITTEDYGFCGKINYHFRFYDK